MEGFCDRKAVWLTQTRSCVSVPSLGFVNNIGQPVQYKAFLLPEVHDHFPGLLIREFPFEPEMIGMGHLEFLKDELHLFLGHTRDLGHDPDHDVAVCHDHLAVNQEPFKLPHRWRRKDAFASDFAKGYIFIF